MVWWMLGFFDSIPREVEAAAVVDGCSFLERFVKIALPLSGPGLVATTLFSMILAWNETVVACITGPGFRETTVSMAFRPPHPIAITPEDGLRTLAAFAQRPSHAFGTIVGR